MENSIGKPPKMQSIRRWSLSQMGYYSEFRVDETVNKISLDFIWLWIAIDQQIRKFLDLVYQKNEICLWQDVSLSNLSEGYGKHSVSTDGGT